MAAPKTRGLGVQHPLITWIRYRTHACTTLRVHSEDSSVTELEIDRAAKSPYRKAALAALSYKPSKIEALNKGGKVLDVWTAEVEDEPAPEPSFTDSVSAELGERLDGESTRLVIFAKLLADAYKNSNAFSSVAFQRLVEVCNSNAERAASLERSLTQVNRTTKRTVTATEETAEPSLLEQVLANVATGMALKQQQANGAAPAADDGEEPGDE
jgi:hypothetical protein